MPYKHSKQVNKTTNQTYHHMKNCELLQHRCQPSEELLYNQIRHITNNGIKKFKNIENKINEGTKRDAVKHEG